MSYTTKTTTGLRVTTAYGASDWVSVHNYNMTRMNDTLLKISGLPDVSIAGLASGHILVYNSTLGKFKNILPPKGLTVVMMTSTSSTTTTTATT